PPPLSTLFPYTTLFRSHLLQARRVGPDVPLGRAGLEVDRRRAARHPLTADRHRVLEQRVDVGRLQVKRELAAGDAGEVEEVVDQDRKSTRLNSSHDQIS